MTETRHTFCRICESLCGLEVDVDASGRIEAIRPDPEHVETGGFACVKGLKQDRLYGSPDRLRYPMKRVGDRHERISWEQALREIGEKVRGLRGEHGPDSIGMYVGTAAGFSLLHPIFAQGFMNGIGSKSVYASSTQDCSNKFAVAREVYGFPFTQPFPDLDHLECLVIVGANPMVSKWSFLQVPNPGKRLREIEARGGRIFVVDPRRTETAKIAGEHVFIRPGMDVFFYLSFLNELIATGGVDEALVRTHTRGFETVRALAAYDEKLCGPISQVILRNRGAGPFGLLNMVDERCGGVFDNIDDVISAKERADFMAGYKAAAGFAIETLNKAPRTIAEGATAESPQPV